MVFFFLVFFVGAQPSFASEYGDAEGSAKYEVPVPVELAPYATLETASYEAERSGDQLTVHYTLPAELTGTPVEGEFSGPVIGNQADLTGPRGAMQCELGEKICRVHFENLRVDLEKVRAALAKLSLTPEERAGRFQVAMRFGGDLEGILYLP